MNTATVARYPRTVAGLLTVIGALVALGVDCSARAAGAPSYAGTFSSTFQYRDGSVWVSGIAYDRARPAAPVWVCVLVAGTCARHVIANQPSGQYDRAHHLTGRHRFTARLGPRRPGVRLVLRVQGTRVAATTVETAGQRAVAIARRYVGARYVEGGASPRTGFDCSGYSLYVYDRARIAFLPHNAEQQRHVSHMRHIARTAARPGDLIFYFSGGPAYHVAIYAGHGYQYAAATYGEGVRYQRIWSSDIEFRTDWH